MGEPKNDWSKWFHPKMIFAERVIPAGQTLDITADQTRVGRDTVIDFLGLSEETFTTVGPGSLNNSFLASLRMNYQITERPWWVNGGLLPVTAFHNLHEGDRSLNGWFPALADRNDVWGRLEWQHAVPWIYNPNDTLTVEYSYPALGAGVALQSSSFVTAVFDGVGDVSGLRRTYRIDGTFFQIPAPPFTQRFSDPQGGHNQGNEPFRMTKVGFIPTTYTGDGNVDNRLLNFFRAKILPSIGDSWSERGVPLAFYGPHISSPYRVAWHKPCGGPVYLRAGQGIVVQIANDSAVPINVQLAGLGRTAFGVGSVGP